MDWEVLRVLSRIPSARRSAPALVAIIASLLALCLPVGTPAVAAGGHRAVVLPADGYGFSGGIDLTRISPTELATELDAVAATSASWLRLTVDWPTIERSRGTYDWTATDRVVNAARARGLKVLGVIAYTPSWARGFWTRHTAPPTVSADYGVFAAAVARHYGKRMAAYELWNEPNLPRMFGGQVNAAKYAELLRSGYAAIKTVRPRMTVISGGLSPDGVDPTQFVRDIYRHGAGNSFDAVGLHPYVGSGDTTHSMRRMSDMITDVRGIMDRHRDRTLEIWLTEFGTSAYAGGPTADNQARVALEQLALAARTPLVGPCFLYEIKDSGPAIASIYGRGHLLSNNGAPKPLAQLLAG